MKGDVHDDDDVLLDVSDNGELGKYGACEGDLKIQIWLKRSVDERTDE